MMRSSYKAPGECVEGSLLCRFLLSVGKHTPTLFPETPPFAHDLEGPMSLRFCSVMRGQEQHQLLEGEGVPYSLPVCPTRPNAPRCRTFSDYIDPTAACPQE